jgi:hypothetical protein
MGWYVNGCACCRWNGGLSRTRFDDKSVYSSRFIMGQLGSTGASRKGIAFDDGSSKSYFSADALQSHWSTFPALVCLTFSTICLTGRIKVPVTTMMVL